MGSRGCLNDVQWRKFSCACHESNPGRPAHSSSRYRLSHPTPHRLHAVLKHNSSNYYNSKDVEVQLKVTSMKACAIDYIISSERIFLFM
jgi:hypothetical protein